MKIKIPETRNAGESQIVALSNAAQWSSAEKLTKLCKGVLNSDALVPAWNTDKLVGLENVISDGLPLFDCVPRLQGQGRTIIFYAYLR